MDCDLPFVGDRLRIHTQTLLGSDKDEFRFKYITILSVLVEVSLVKCQKLPEDHQDLLLRDGRTALLLVCDPGLEGEVVVAFIAQNGKFIFF